MNSLSHVTQSAITSINLVISMLQGRVACVTGGASGIGRATALLLAEQGARVFVFDWILDAERNAADFGRLGISMRQVDVREEKQVEDAIKEAGGQVDILVNSAGVTLVKQIPDVTEEEWDRVFDINLKGAFLMCKHAIPSMKRRGGGVIVNISSNAGLLPRAHDPVYSTSKGSLQAFTRSLALCHAPDRIRVNSVCPGPVSDTKIMNTDLAKEQDQQSAVLRFIKASPLAAAHGRMITPLEVAQSVLYLVSDAASMVTGTSIAIDGGKSLGVPPMM